MCFRFTAYESDARLCSRHSHRRLDVTMTFFESLGLSARRVFYGEFMNWLTVAWHKPTRADDLLPYGANQNLKNLNDVFVLHREHFSIAG